MLHAQPMMGIKPDCQLHVVIYGQNKKCPDGLGLRSMNNCDCEETIYGVNNLTDEKSMAPKDLEVDILVCTKFM